MTNQGVIILLHGAIGASDQLIPLSQHLKSKGFHTFLFEFSGHGKKEFSGEFNINQFTSELNNFIQENKFIQPNIFGYSMGGYVAINLASEKPSLLGRIITLGTKFKWNETIARKEIQQLNPKLIEEKVPKFAESLKLRHGNKWKEVLSKTAEMMIDMGKRPFLGSGKYSSITNHVLIGIGDKDEMVSLEETVEVYRSLPHANMYMLPQTKHPIERVDVSLLAEIIERYIKSNSN